jgi:hypothetical protein
MSTSDDEKMIRLENATAIPAMAKLGGWVTQRVETALAPALEGRRKYSCLHILDDILKKWSIPFGEEIGLVGRKPLLCPLHPDRLLCNRPQCVTDHLYQHHRREHEAACFVCEEPMIDPITHVLRDDYEGVTAIIQLHQQVPFYDDNRGRDRWYVYRGELVTLPMAYLCPRHAGLLELPVRMAWPTVMHDAG